MFGKSIRIAIILSFLAVPIMPVIACSEMEGSSCQCCHLMGSATEESAEACWCCWEMEEANVDFLPSPSFASSTENITGFPLLYTVHSSVTSLAFNEDRISYFLPLAWANAPPLFLANQAFLT